LSQGERDKLEWLKRAKDKVISQREAAEKVLSPAVCNQLVPRNGQTPPQHVKAITRQSRSLVRQLALELRDLCDHCVRSPVSKQDQEPLRRNVGEYFISEFIVVVRRVSWIETKPVRH
jgi:hypothetical protein